MTEYLIKELTAPTNGAVIILIRTKLWNALLRWLLVCIRSYLVSVLKFVFFPRQAEVAKGVPGRLWPRIIVTFRHYKGGRSSAKPTRRLYTRRNPWYSLSEAESTSGNMVLWGVPRKESPVSVLK